MNLVAEKIIDILVEESYCVKFREIGRHFFQAATLYLNQNGSLRDERCNVSSVYMSADYAVVYYIHAHQRRQKCGVCLLFQIEALQLVVLQLEAFI